MHGPTFGISNCSLRDLVCRDRILADVKMLYVVTVLVVILQTVQGLRAGPISMNAIQSIKARQIYVCCAI